ncbi:MAG: D-2-hydroxyacid dehydrogenase [Selenomonadaceae bacterium]|nr:D-2-hydroxyacid dehydrogenase [Selenomonadaceae bacterium]
MKIVILDGYTLNPGDLSWDKLKNLGECIIYDRTSLVDEAEIIERIGDAEIVITNKTPITKNVFDACRSIKYIGVLATGYNVVDVETAKSKNIPVCNIPTYGTTAVAQFAIALLLEICHHVGHHNKAVKSGRWENNEDWCFWDYPLIELAGKTMGIIGYGRIGQTTGKLSKALGMTVIAFDAMREVGTELDGTKFVELDELFNQSDVIALHCPLFPSTQGIINKENIAKMKDGVIIINNSRGPLIVEQDLRDALDSGKVYAAGLDVVSTEPIKSDNPLLGAKNCIITPHISWAPKESRQRLMDIAVDNVSAFLSGKPINVVNP